MVQKLLKCDEVRQIADTLKEVKFPCLSAGYVKLIDVLGSDYRIVQAARTTSAIDAVRDADDYNLLRYLFRHRHGTPFEFSQVILELMIPMDAWRQWVRHRMFCLSGDTELHFDLPGGGQTGPARLYKLTIAQVYEKFQPTANPSGECNAFVKRDRVQAMRLRCLNEETKEVEHTQIVDVWQSGVKTVYRVTLANGSSLKMSADHLCLADCGWRKLTDLVTLPTEGSVFPDNVRLSVVGKGKHTGVPTAPHLPSEAELELEEWQPIVGWETYYQVSNYGRVRRIVGGKGSRSYGRCKKVTYSESGTRTTAVVSLNRPGEQTVKSVHQLVAEAFIGPCPAGQECCHEDGNALNNFATNLRWDTPQSNADDRVRDGATVALAHHLEYVTQVEILEPEMTYDIEVAGPWHNFAAEGVVVHNSINEYSTRYSKAIDTKDVTDPAAWRLQSTANRQGSGGLLTAKVLDLPDWPTTEDAQPGVLYKELDEALELGFLRCVHDGEVHHRILDASLWKGTVGEAFSHLEKQFHKAADANYNLRVAGGVALEQARKDLPLSTYTKAWWTGDVRNLYQFLSLRMDAHAQKEIRDYANTIGNEIMAKLFPVSFQAFKDYDLNSINFTALDLAYVRWNVENGRSSQILTPATFKQSLQDMANMTPDSESPLADWLKERSRERDECFVKLCELGMAKAG